MTVTASMVKELRERTGAVMMDCKKALQETNGDVEEAIALMRKNGQAKAAKRAGKIAAEGVIVLQASDDKKKACLVEVNSETDFVARNEDFQAFAAVLAQRGLDTEATDAGALLQSPIVEGKEQTLDQVRQGLVVTIGENIQLRRVANLHSDNGVVGAYKHGDRIGVIVSLDGDAPELAKDIAMHIAAMNPQAIDADNVPSELIEKEREIFSAQAKESGKPDNIVEKMVTGRITKFLKEICLLDQGFVKNPEQTIRDLLKTKNVKVTGFVRFEVGEGIEKKTQDFAEEVKAQVRERE